MSWMLRTTMSYTLCLQELVGRSHDLSIGNEANESIFLVSFFRGHRLGLIGSSDVIVVQLEHSGVDGTVQQLWRNLLEQTADYNSFRYYFILFFNYKIEINYGAGALSDRLPNTVCP